MHIQAVDFALVMPGDTQLSDIVRVYLCEKIWMLVFF